MPVSSLIPYVTIITMVVGIGFAVYDHFRNTARPHEENQRYRRSYRERHTSVGECGRCDCSICGETIFGDRTFISCSMCRRCSWKVHNKCSDEICDDCFKKGIHCRACKKPIVEKQLIVKTNCSKCKGRSFFLHRTCSQKASLCDLCEPVGTCDCCHLDILRRHRPLSANCSMCNKAGFTVHLECKDKVKICDDCFKKGIHCRACKKPTAKKQPIVETKCSTCKEESFFVHKTCSWKTTLCDLCEPVRTCDCCHLDILRRHRPLSANCSMCNKAGFTVHLECKDKILTCTQCKRLPKDCLFCKKPMSDLKALSVVNCATCSNWKSAVHTACSKGKTKIHCPHCVADGR